MQSHSNLKCIWTNAYLIELFDLCSKSFDMTGGSKRHGFSILVLRETLVLQRICPKHVCVYANAMDGWVNMCIRESQKQNLHFI